MQNLSISCALVCLIILGSAALIGAFGVCQRQISAILVTGVMYLLAGNIDYSGMHFKTFFLFTYFHFSSFCIVHAYDYTFQTSKRQVFIR